MKQRIEAYFLDQYDALSERNFRRIRLQYYFLFVSILFAMGYYLNTYFTNFLVARYLMVLSIALFSALLAGIKLRLSIAWITQLFILICWSIIIILSLFSGGINSYVLPWLVMIPIIARVLTTDQFTWLWVAVSVTTVFVFYAFEESIFVPQQYVVPGDSILTLSLHVGLILIIFWLTYIFEINQRSFVEKIEKQNEELVAIDEELRQSLEELSTTQERLAEKEAESRSIVEALREHFLITEFDTEGTITYANRKVVDMTKSNPIGLNRFKQMDHSMSEKRSDEWNLIIAGESNSGESYYEVKGHEFWVMSTYAPIKNRLGKVARIMSVAHEITETKKREKELSEVNTKLSKALDAIQWMNNQLEERVHKRTAELEEKNKYLAEYAFINSHLLRAPLCRLMGLIQLLEYTDISKADAQLLTYLRMAGNEIDSVVARINLAIEKGSYFDREVISGNFKTI